MKSAKFFYCILCLFLLGCKENVYERELKSNLPKEMREELLNGILIDLPTDEERFLFTKYILEQDRRNSKHIENYNFSHDHVSTALEWQKMMQEIEAEHYYQCNSRSLFNKALHKKSSHFISLDIGEISSKTLDGTLDGYSTFIEVKNKSKEEIEKIKIDIAIFNKKNKKTMKMDYLEINQRIKAKEKIVYPLEFFFFFSGNTKEIKTKESNVVFNIKSIHFANGLKIKQIPQEPNC